MEIGIPVNSLGFKYSSIFQIKLKFVWSIISLQKPVLAHAKIVLNFMRYKFLVPVSIFISVMNQILIHFICGPWINK